MDNEYIPMYHSIPSFKFLVNTYINSEKFSSFSDWLRKVFNKWNTFLNFMDDKPKIQKDGKEIKRYSLKNMVKFLKDLESEKHLEMFLEEVDSYYKLLYKLGKDVKIRHWDVDGKIGCDVFFYSNKTIEKYKRESPYI